MRGGRLRHKAQFQRATEAKDAYGGTTLAWKTYGNGWIGYEVQEGGEGNNDAKREATQSLKVMARFLDGVVPTDRLKLSNRVLEILHVADPDGRRRELMMTCREVLNG